MQLSHIVNFTNMLMWATIFSAVLFKNDLLPYILFCVLTVAFGTYSYHRCQKAGKTKEAMMSVEKIAVSALSAAVWLAAA